MIKTVHGSCFLNSLSGHIELTLSAKMAYLFDVHGYNPTVTKQIQKLAKLIK